MKALFIHDHKFPRDKNNNYYYSYGFDSEFFSRYLDIFDELSIFGRDTEVDNEDKNLGLISESKSSIYTVTDFKEVLYGTAAEELKQVITDSEICVVRLPSILGLIALKTIRKMKKPYIIELVGCPWDSFINMGNKKYFAPIMRGLTRKEVRQSKYTVYVTNNFLQQRYPTNGDWISCSNVTIKNIDPKNLQDRLSKISKISGNIDKLVIGTVGTVGSKYKGHHYVIQALPDLIKKGFNIEFHLVGGGDYSNLLELAKDLNVEGKVFFHGKKSHFEIFDWIKELDLYIQPSDTEGLPRSVIEAMSVGAPIIGSNAGGIPELIEENLIFNKGQVDEIVSLIENLNKEILSKSAERNFNKSTEYYKPILYQRRKDFFNIVMENEGHN